MAVVPGASTTVTQADIIYTEYISAMMRETLGRIPVVYPLAVLYQPLAGLNTDTYSHNLGNEVSIADPLAETDEVTSSALGQAKTQVSTAMFAKATFISDQNAVRALWNMLGWAGRELTGSCARRIDTDFCNLATSFTAPIGNASQAMSVDFLVTLLTAWRSRTGSTSSRPLLVMHGDAMRDLQRDSVQNGASWFSTAAGVQLHDATSGLNQGQVTSWNSIDMVVSDRMPVGDSTGWANMMVARGDDEAAIAMAFEQEIQIEVWREPKRKGLWVIASVNYGVGKVNDLAGLQFITRT